MSRWERSIESWQVSDASILGGRRGQVEATAEEQQPQLENTSARGRIGHALPQGDIAAVECKNRKSFGSKTFPLHWGLVGPATDDGLVDPYGAAVSNLISQHACELILLFGLGTKQIYVWVIQTVHPSLSYLDRPFK